MSKLARLGEQSLNDELDSLGCACPGGGLRGTPAYMSPEQAAGESATAASDVFSLAVLLFELLTGRAAFAGQSIAHILEQIRGVDAEQFAAVVPGPFADVLRQAMVRDVVGRRIRMHQIAELLGGVKTG